MKEKLDSSLSQLATWVEQHNYKGYDPGDGLTSFLRPLAFGNTLGERLLLQLIWKSPINLRPVLGVKPQESTKGRGFMAYGYLLLYKATGQVAYKNKAITCLDWLIANKVEGQPGYSWGNHFDFVTRGGCIPAKSPTIVWSGLIGQAFLEAYEQTQEPRFLEVARGICTWILKLPRDKSDRGHCLSYVAFSQSSIHNSNLLGAGMLARTWKHTREQEYLDVAREAVLYSCSHQLEDGAWWYGESPKHHWIDNFHTGYNLDSIKRYIDNTGDKTFTPAMDKGLDYFKRTFFDPDGRPRYYHNRAQPIDIQCASQAIDTLAFFASRDPACLELAQKVAHWTMDNMQDPTGYIYYRKYPLFTAKTPYMHWGQATTFKALAHLRLILG